MAVTCEAANGCAVACLAGAGGFTSINARVIWRPRRRRLACGAQCERWPLGGAAWAWKVRTASGFRMRNSEGPPRRVNFVRNLARERKLEGGELLGYSRSSLLTSRSSPGGGRLWNRICVHAPEGGVDLFTCTLSDWWHFCKREVLGISGWGRRGKRVPRLACMAEEAGIRYALLGEPAAYPAIRGAGRGIGGW